MTTERRWACTQRCPQCIWRAASLPRTGSRTSSTRRAVARAGARRTWPTPLCPDGPQIRTVWRLYSGCELRNPPAHGIQGLVCMPQPKVVWGCCGGCEPSTPPCLWNTDACSIAANGGHLEVLQWMRAHHPPCPWDRDTCLIAAQGRIEVVQWVRTQPDFGLDEEEEWSSDEDESDQEESGEGV
ncbi:hypothetical protein B484DRAFT_94261 [Ochromonadaceae sp. CCMP2298]|nr:hypothetical protein B484DRAFT_94261 [Ochromonadaceae sp. CCMP2298]